MIYTRLIPRQFKQQQLVSICIINIIIILALTYCYPFKYVFSLRTHIHYLAKPNCRFSFRKPSAVQESASREPTPNRSVFRKHTFFLKTHKTASSTVQNILMRFGLRHSLDSSYPNSTTISVTTIPSMTTTWTRT